MLPLQDFSITRSVYQFLYGCETDMDRFRTAKACGCKFYPASDAHHPDGLDNAKERFERAITLLVLEETDKFVL